MSELITSTANPKVKRLRKLADRRERAREGVYLAEGLRIVIEAVQLNKQIETLVVAPDLLVSQAGIETVQAFRAKHPEQVMDVSAEVFRSFSGKDGPQGIAAILRPDWLALEEIRPVGSDCWVALDEVADPGNLGTILRTADSAGARGVILLDNCTDPYDPSALRASMGAVFSLGICKASFEQFAAWKKQTGVQLIGTSDRAREDYYAASYTAPLVILMGSEREGLEQRHFDLCDQVVSIPMNGRSDSLNLAVATAILLYETYQQTRAGRPQEGK